HALQLHGDRLRLERTDPDGEFAPRLGLLDEADDGRAARRIDAHAAHLDLDAARQCSASQRGEGEGCRTHVARFYRDAATRQYRSNRAEINLTPAGHRRMTSLSPHADGGGAASPARDRARG